MARVAFKTAIYRTNPHVMRCFVIDDTRTIEELIQTALISHGIVSDQSVKMFRNTATIGHSAKIHDMFNENSKKDRWRICVPIKTNVNQSVYNINRQEEWIINISMVDLEDSDMESYAEPALVLARGIQKHRSINDTYTFNMMHSSIIARNFYYGNSNIVYAEEVMPSIDKINKQIEKKLSKNGKEAEVFIANMNRTMPMNKIFEKFRVDDLKLTIQIQRYPIPYVKSKKADIVRALVNYYSREKGFWKKVIEEMPIEEYMAFKNYVSDDGDSDDIKSADCRTLNKYMLCFLDGYDNCISKELVE